jgi:hypothetical protein
MMTVIGMHRGGTARLRVLSCALNDELCALLTHGLRLRNRGIR